MKNHTKITLALIGLISLSGCLFDSDEDGDETTLSSSLEVSSALITSSAELDLSSSDELQSSSSIELSSEAARWLADKGYDDKMGARPLARIIQEHLKKPLAEELLFGKLSKGGLVKVHLKDDKLDLELISPEARQITKRKPPLLTAK